jgi:hypothetical protein
MILVRLFQGPLARSSSLLITLPSRSMIVVPSNHSVTILGHNTRLECRTPRTRSSPIRDMNETPTDFVDIPGMPPIKWDGWDSTKPVSTRRIQLPIQMRISRRVGFGWLLLALCAFAAALFLLGLYTEAAAYFRGQLCLGKHGVSSHGNCAFSAFACLAGLLFLLIAIARAVGFITLGRRIRKSAGIQLEIKRETFWHFQLYEPLPFENIVEVTASKLRNEIDTIALRCRTPPRLAFWSFSNRLLWSRKDAVFYFVAVAFSPATLPQGKSNYAVLFDVIKALAESAAAKTL